MSLHRSKKIIKKHQIEIAMEMLMTSMVIVYGYVKNKGHELTENDLKMLDLFVEELHRHYCSSSFITSCLHHSGRYEAKYDIKNIDFEIGTLH